MSKMRVTLFGGNGFLGRYVVNKLAETGAQIVIACRRPHEIAHLKPLCDVGQITGIYCDITSKESVETALQGATHAINLVGILHESGKNSYQSAHEKGARNIAETCATKGVKRLIHVGSLISTDTPHSEYGKTKQAGTKAIQDAYPNATIFKPSVMYGAEDQFMTRFAAMAETFRMVPLVNTGQTKFQPVYVGDVADAIVHALLDVETEGKTYELGGNKTYTFKEIIEIMAKSIHRDPFILSLPTPIAKFGAVMTSFLKNPPLTLDQIKALKDDSIISEKALGFKDLNIRPKKLKNILPEILTNYIPREYHGN